MRSISRAIDKFCIKHRRFGIPKLMRYVVFISAAIYVISMMDKTGTLFSFIAFHPRMIARGEIWRLVTWVFIPLGDNVIFTAISLYFYYFIGTTLEREWGTPKFTIYYLAGIALNIIYGFVTWFIIKSTMYSAILDYVWYGFILLTPSFLNLSMFFAFAALFPDNRVMLFFIIPIKVKWLALVDAGFFIYYVIERMVNAQYAMALLPIVAILNFIIICGGDVIDYLRPYKARASPQVVKFRRAAKQAQRSNEDSPFRHKCSVCGKTDAEYPGLEFRYCSRCEGYHCYCIDHINSHIHIV
ncbi:MAG: rhomboid family intramembrane serine protease [Oscillospiraceae bacterium]|nr:rhomboid family intramembrane serine protease [Oscillospiraceae bacterium]